MKQTNTTLTANLEWVEPLAKHLKGKIQGNFIVPPKKISSGSIYFLDCGNGISVMHVDLTYNSNFEMFQKNKMGDYVAFYYNINETATQAGTDELSNFIGKWHYNLILIDSNLNHRYAVNAGTRALTFCVFVKKTTIKTYIEKSTKFKKNIPHLLDPKKNTFIEFNRMTNDNVQLLNELKNVEIGSPTYNLQLIATANILFSDYMDKIATVKNVIQKVNDTDLSSILEAQKELALNVEGSFPGIEIMAKKANMSETKFKMLFKKITRTSANNYFLNCKLDKAKDLLTEKQNTISQIANQLNFATNSYFIAKFKEQYGVTPKTYTQQLI